MSREDWLWFEQVVQVREHTCTTQGCECSHSYLKDWYKWEEEEYRKSIVDNKPNRGWRSQENVKFGYGQLDLGKTRWTSGVQLVMSLPHRSYITQHKRLI